MMRLATLLLALLLATVGSTAIAAAGDRLEIIELRNRPAEEVIPLVRPLLQPQDALTGTGYQLIIRATPERIREVRELVDALDQAQKNLLVTVSAGRAEDLRDREIGASGRIENERGSVTLGDTDEEGLHGTLRERSTRNQATRASSLRVLEGQSAFIRTGGDVPYITTAAIITGNRVITSSGVEYRRVETGFYVTPRISGDRVYLHIRPVQQSLQSDQTIATQEAETTISGPVGEWITIGGVTEEERYESNGTVSRQWETRGRDDAISVKVEVVQ
jgi:type II secretory pathway component HofQ